MSEPRVAALLVIGAFLARFVAYLGTGIFGTDSAQFLLMAQWMGEGRFQEALEITYHPLYPLLVAAAAPLAGGVEPAGFWVSMVLGSAAAAPLYFLVSSTFGRPAAFLTGIFYCFQPHTVDLQADVMTEGTFSFFLFGAAWLCRKGLGEPSVERALLAGLSASAAYLTRPEGILAVAFVTLWPVAEWVRARDRAVARLGGAGLAFAAAVLLAFPFLLWVRKETGAWGISAKGSVRNAGLAPVPDGEAAAAPGEEATPVASRYGRFAKSILRVTSGVTIPFFLLGLGQLRGRGLWGPLFYFSLPAAYLGGLLWSLRSHPYWSYRYVVPSMNLLFVLAALGILAAARYAERRWPGRRWALGAAALVGLAAVAPYLRHLRPHRTEEAAVREAGAWLRARGATRVASTTDKIGFFIGRKVLPFPGGAAELHGEGAPEYYVYLEKDLTSGKRPDLSRLGEGAAPPVVFPDPPRPGVWKLYVRPARR